MNIILFGFKNAGKNRFGTLVAKRMEMRFLDTDDLIEELYYHSSGQKLTMRQVFEKIGPSGFRELESNAVASLVEVTNSVIAVGGGTILDHVNRSTLESIGKLVYLHVTKETLKVRTLSGDLPAYLDARDPVGSFERLYEDRKPIYESIPAEWVNTEGKSDEQIIDILCTIVETEETDSGE